MLGIKSDRERSYIFPSHGHSLVPHHLLILGAEQVRPGRFLLVPGHIYTRECYGFDTLIIKNALLVITNPA